MRASPLARFLLLAWALLAVYASLYPLTGWRDPGVSAFAFLTAAWPRYVTVLDLTMNVAAYAPFGALCVLALYPRVRGVAAVVVALAAGALLSFALEAAQSFLPARISSNVDWLCNMGGTLLGAVAVAPVAGWALEAGPLKRMRAAAFEAGVTADLGLVVLGLWLFAQLNPATLLFGLGDLRALFATLPAIEQPPTLFVSIEALTAAANLTAAALILASIASATVALRALVLALIAAALVVKVLAFAILVDASNILAWLTPGAQRGLVLGLVLALLGVGLSGVARLILAAILLMAATVLVNLAPPNPYRAAILSVWSQGHFLNFNGLTRLVSSVWPFVALAYLIWLASRRARAALG
ncbi:MAG TPA: VanZ family protein [Burkholderiales bacterium]|nr:VanZ family protein [Burkholderiales bacterium]